MTTTTDEHAFCRFHTSGWRMLPGNISWIIRHIKNGGKIALEFRSWTGRDGTERERKNKCARVCSRIITQAWKLRLFHQIFGFLIYCAFHEHANSKVQKPPSQLRFSLPSIIITITSNKPWNTETHKTDWNPPITNHKPWPFEPVKVKFCFLGGPLGWLTAAKNSIVCWLLNFRIRMFVKSAVGFVGVHTKRTCVGARLPQVNESQITTF